MTWPILVTICWLDQYQCHNSVTYNTIYIKEIFLQPTLLRKEWRYKQYSNIRSEKINNEEIALPESESVILSGNTQ